MPTKAKATAPAFNEDAVRQRAYLMWEADGRPDGMADHYWLKAMDVPPAANKAKAKAKAAAAKAPAAAVQVKAPVGATAKKLAKKATKAAKKA